MEVGVAMPRLNDRDDEERQKIDELYSLLKEEGTTCHTPLHDAAAAGMSHLALEVANLKPLLTRKLNHEGLSPMHLALHNSHVQTVRALMAFDSSLMRVKGRDLITPLHYAAELGETELLAEFLSSCHSSVEDLTSRCETVVHVAVRSKKLDACKVLVGWLIRMDLEEILNWKDEDGNTVLHIATLSNQPKVMKLLIKHVKVNAKNFAGLTALDLCSGEGHQLDLNAEVRKILSDAKARRASTVGDSLTGAGYLGQTELFLMERWDRRQGLTNAKSRAKYRAELRNMTLVVAVLIVAATYEGIVSLPGGFWQDGSTAGGGHGNYAPSLAVVAAGGPPHTAGKMIVKGLHRIFFLELNSVAFLISVIIIIFTLVGWGVESPFVLSLPVVFVAGTYILAVIHSVTNEEDLALSTAALAVHVICVVALVPFVCRQRLNKRKARLDVPGRRIVGFI